MTSSDHGDFLTDHARNDPQTWIRSCRRILNAVEVIACGIHANRNDDLKSSDGILAALMLVGFAFENAFKAEYLSRGNRLYHRGVQTKLKWHEFERWTAELSLDLNEWERDSLKKAEFVCTGWGRYPFHNDAEKDQKMIVTLSIEDVDQVRNVVGRLLEAAGGRTTPQNDRV